MFLNKHIKALKVLHFISMLILIYQMSEFPRIHTIKSKRVFLYPTQISKHLRCHICQDVFQEPVRTICGHTFCYICIQQSSSIKMVCPVCNKSIAARKLQKDLMASTLVDDLRVKCVHNGCNWQGLESIRKKHQRCCSFKPKNQNIPESSSIQLLQPNDIEGDFEESQYKMFYNQQS